MLLRSAARKVGSINMFLVDFSGSIAVEERMTPTEGARGVSQ
jgi:Mg-chelatase subunit ChlD